jgi:hypothetical protein
MRFLKSKPEQYGVKKDRTAALIAAQIISWQIALSRRLNHWINGYTARKQRMLLLLFFAAITGSLALSLFSDHSKMPIHQSGNYIPAHIGKPSDNVSPGHTVGRTDSVTSKK